MNDDISRYSKHCGFHKSGVTTALQDYSNFLECRDGDCIMDVGAGEGSVNLDVLLSKLPKNFKKIVLCDVSPKLLQFAKAKIADERVHTFEMDIGSSGVPDEFRQHFDHIFSFYCLHWISDWEKSVQVMKNIFEMLKPQGDIFFIIVTSAPVIDVWKNLAKTEKWTPYFKNAPTFPYYDMEDPAETLKTCLEDIGFVVDVCKKEDCLYTFQPFSDFLNFAISINPCLGSISEEKRANYNQVYEKELTKHPEILFEKMGSENEKVHFPYKRLVVCGIKPSGRTQM